MIPKQIHYCWFGGNEKPGQVQKCIESWRKVCPNYNIIEWNDDNFDFDQYPYLRWCYENKKWAFLSDFARLIIISEHGGIYFDTDVELIKSPDELLNYEAFYGFENNEYINTGQGFGAAPHHCTVRAMLETYVQLKPEPNGQYPLAACPALNTKALLPYGLRLDGSRQNVAGAEILPAEYMNPYDDPTGKFNITKNTVSIHWYSKSWMSRGTILRSKLTRPIHRIFGVNALARFRT